MARIPRVIVGLGCEGQDWTRQNLGAEFVKAFAKRLNVSFELRKLREAHVLEAQSPAAGGLRLVLPLASMSGSGLACKEYLRSTSTSFGDFAVAHSSPNYERGKLELRRMGGAQEKGVASVMETLGLRRLWRVRVGLSRPRHAEYSAFLTSCVEAAEQEFFEARFLAFADLYLRWLEAEARIQRTKSAPISQHAAPAISQPKPSRTGAP